MEQSKLIVGVVLLLAILTAAINTGYVTGAVTSNCVPVTLTAGQGKIVHGQTVRLIDLIGAGEVSLSVNELTVIATLGHIPTVEGLSIEVVDTRFTPDKQNRVANLIICENA